MSMTFRPRHPLRHLAPRLPSPVLLWLLNLPYLHIPCAQMAPAHLMYCAGRNRHFPYGVPGRTLRQCQEGSAPGSTASGSICVLASTQLAPVRPEVWGCLSSYYPCRLMRASWSLFPLPSDGEDGRLI